MNQMDPVLHGLLGAASAAFGGILIGTSIRFGEGCFAIAGVLAWMTFIALHVFRGKIVKQEAA